MRGILNAGLFFVLVTMLAVHGVLSYATADTPKSKDPPFNQPRLKWAKGDPLDAIPKQGCKQTTNCATKFDCWDQDVTHNGITWQSFFVADVFAIGVCYVGGEDDNFISCERGWGRCAEVKFKGLTGCGGADGSTVPIYIDTCAGFIN